MAYSQQNFELLTERISDAYCAIDTEWQITYWNERLAEWTGLQATAVDGKRIWDVLPGLRHSTLENACHDAMERRESRSFELQLDDPVNAWVAGEIYADEHGLSLLLRDVTERKQREKHLELSETLFENAQDGLFLIDVTGDEDEFRVERVNPAYEADTGLSNADLRGRGLRDIFGETEGTEIIEHYRECVTRREPIEYDERVSVPDGIYWETRVAPVIIDGTIEKLVGSTRNITQRKERERQYDAIFNQTYQFIGLIEPDGTLLQANDSALEFGGLEREDVIGAPFWELGWWQLEETIPKRLQESIESAAAGEFVRYDVEVGGVDETAIIDFSIRPITDERGEVRVLVTEGRNITDHKRRERELKRNREFLKHIQSVADIGGWEVDLRSETVQWTEEVYRICGVPADYEPTVEEAIGMYHPDDRPIVENAWNALTTAGKAYDLELRIVTPDDEIRWIRTIGEPWYDDDEVIGAHGAVRDITGRKERLYELEQSNKRLEEFASVVSHDLRNPLTVAQLSLELGRESGLAADFDRIEAAHDRMNALIEDLLTLARERRHVVERHPVDLESLIESIRETNLTDDVSMDVEADGYRIDADRPRLRQLLENLFSNAVRHGGKDVTIRVGVLDDSAGFYVEDDGPGIAPETRELIFTQGYSTTSEGTGFGLAIVKSIVDAHGWAIEVTDSADGGARFTILDSRLEQPDSAHSSQHPPEQGST